VTRLPKDRETHLSAKEIASEALRQFDANKTEPSIRSLAEALNVAPSAIYHHYPSRAAIVQAAVERVWWEATSGLLELTPDPFEADPTEVLVNTGLASRRAWLAHYRLAPYLAASPEVNDFTRDALGLMSGVFEKLGLSGEDAAAAFHIYAAFMIGSVLFTASRKAANEQLAAETGEVRFRVEHTPETEQRSSEQTRAAIDETMALAVADPVADEQLFAEGLRRLVASLARGD
jgi:AcrR family transcriptional regulator